MNLNDILGFGKVLPIDKLIDIVSNSVGKISKSYFDKKDVDTKAYEIEKLAEARAKEMKIISTAMKENYLLTGGIEYKEEKFAIISPKEPLTKTPQAFLINATLTERAQERTNFQEAKKQLNIENVTAFAAEELRNEPPITDEPLDEDWTTRFFRIVEDVSNEEMQALWGKILAGEIKQPKSYSLRTLELIRNLSQNDADIFMKVAKFAVKSGDKYYIFNGTNKEKMDKDFGIKYGDIALLTEIGLIQPGTFVQYMLLQQPTDSESILLAGNVILIIKIKANTPTINMPVDVFSNAGNELMNLINPAPPMNYLSYLANSIKNENVDVQYANVLSIDEENINHTFPLQDF